MSFGIDEKQPLLPSSTPASPAVLDAVSIRPRRSCFRKILTRTLHITLLLAIVLCFFPRVRTHFKNIFPGHSSAVGHMEPYWDGHEHECVEEAQWTHRDDDHGHPHRPHRYHHFARTTFELPQVSDLLYFVGRGVLSHGAVLISNEGDSDKVGVEVFVEYDHDEVFQEAKVCKLQRGENDHGVGIFSPPRWNRHPGSSGRIHFVVRVMLPSTGDITEYKALETDMPLFYHHASELAPALSFESVDLKTSNTAIVVGSILAERIMAKSSNAPIQGSFNALDSLELHTSNSNIKADITLANSGSRDPSRLWLRTSNGPVQANVSLISHEDGGGKFNVLAETSNSLSDVRIVEAPVNSTLTFNAHTSNSPIRATLPRAYEGSFDLTAMPWTTPSLRFDLDVNDPAGRGRKRSVRFSTAGRGHVAGSVAWDGGHVLNREGGSANLKTSNGPAELILL